MRHDDSQSPDSRPARGSTEVTACVACDPLLCSSLPFWRPPSPASLSRPAPARRRCAFRLMCRRETTSRSTTTSPSRCGTASSCSPMCIVRRAKDAIRCSSRRPPTVPNAFPVRTRRPSTSRSAATSTSTPMCEGATNPKAAGGRSSTRRRTATMSSNGRQSSRGPTARSRCRVARISGRTNGGLRRRRRPAWSRSFRWSRPRASITTGSRSTAPGGSRSTSVGDRCAWSRASCRTPVRTPRPACAASTTTRCSGTCRSTRCSSASDATRGSTTSGSRIPITMTTGSR